MSSFFGKNLPDWTDMSDFVVHFTKNFGDKSAYENMQSILYSKSIKARNPTGNYFFEWEREWRKVGNYKFEPYEVEFLIIPAKLHEKARTFFDMAEAENLGPSYTCPFIDPYWKLKKIKPLLPKYVD